jgi:hypothetical protein
VFVGAYYKPGFVYPLYSGLANHLSSRTIARTIKRF